MKIFRAFTQRYAGSASRPRLMLERLEDRCTPATFDLNGTVLTVNGTTGDDHFQFAQVTTTDNNIFFTTNYTFTLNGQSQTYTNNRRSEFGPVYAVTQVIVNGNGGNDTGVLITNDTHVDVNGFTRETSEQAFLGRGFITQSGGGYSLYLDDPGVAGPFLSFKDFQNTYAYMGRADSGELRGDGSVANILVTAGSYCYLTGGGDFHLISGAPSVIGLRTGANDQAWNYDVAGSLDAFVASGNAFSYMSGTDANGNSFFNEAVGYNVSYGIATHGNAIAYLIDSPGNDVFVGCATYSYLSGNDELGGVFNVAEGFGTVYGQSFVGGADYAYNYAPGHNVLSGFHMLT